MRVVYVKRVFSMWGAEPIPRMESPPFLGERRHPSWDLCPIRMTREVRKVDMAFFVASFKLIQVTYASTSRRARITDGFAHQMIEYIVDTRRGESVNDDIENTFRITAKDSIQS